jgi:hypothetical protein
MKLIKYIFAVALTMSILLGSSLSYAQTEYPHFGDLRGLEDSSGHTQLFYRVYSMTQSGSWSYTNSDIYRFSIEQMKEAVYLASGTSDYGIDIHFGSVVNAYQIWSNDYKKYICASTSYGSDLGSDISRFDKTGAGFIQGYPNKFFISKQNDSLLYADAGGKSTDGGRTWNKNALINGAVVALSPLNDSIIFYRDAASYLYKTTNGGLSSAIADSERSTSDVFAFSADGLHVFRTSWPLSAFSYWCKLSISSGAGEVGTWVVLDTVKAAIYISLDDINKRLYVGYGRTVKVYDYNGIVQPESYRLPKDIVGLYKKPGTSTLYTASMYEIDEWNGGTKTILKQLPVALDNAAWYPLAIGNTWVYKGESYYPGKYSATISVVGDTVAKNGLKYFKLLRKDSNATTTSFVRYDTLSGEIRRIELDHEYTSYMSYVDISDTVGWISSWPVIYKKETNDTILSTISAHRYFGSTNVLGDQLSYEMKKGLGIVKHSEIGETESYRIETLAAAIIDGKIYGDTTLLETRETTTNLLGSFVLYQNYPNPFNPSTTIRYAIPKAGQVKLNVYSVTGKLVASLVDEYKTAGNYAVNFNATNLASGVYFYRLTSGAFVENRKMILIK